MDHLSHTQQRPRGARKNIYLSNQAQRRLARLTLNGGEAGFSATIEKALVLLERDQQDYLERISAAIHGLAALPLMDEREQIILELASLLDNELAARAIAQAVVDVVVLGSVLVETREHFLKEKEE
jgi:hypothetical protein